MVKHIVLWNIKEGLDKEETIKKLQETLLPLIDLVPSLKHIEVGANFNSKESGKDVCLYSEFEDQAGLEAYIVHPAHKKAGTYVRSVVCDRSDADFEI